MSDPAPTPERTHLPILPTGRAEQLIKDAQGGVGSATLSPNSPAPNPPAPTSPAPTSPLTSLDQKLIEGKVIAAISKIYDPEIPVNIYELGLIYKIEVDAERNVKV